MCGEERFLGMDERPVAVAEGSELLSARPYKGGHVGMWIYEKKLEYPVKIKKPNPKLAKIILEQYGGKDGLNYIHRESLGKSVFSRVSALVTCIQFQAGFRFCERLYC